MPDGRMADEPTHKELQIRIRKWLQWRWRTLKRHGWTQVDLAKAMGLHKVTVGDLLKNKELPGLETYKLMHWRLQLDAYRMLHADPEEDAETGALPPQVATPRHTDNHPTKHAGRKLTRGQKSSL